MTKPFYEFFRKHIPGIFMILSIFWLPVGIKPSNICIVTCFAMTLIAHFRSIRVETYHIILAAFVALHVFALSYTSPQNFGIGWALIERYLMLMAITLLFPVIIRNKPELLRPALIAFVAGVITSGIWYYISTYIFGVDQSFAINRVYLGMFVSFCFVAVYFLWGQRWLSPPLSIVLALVLMVVLVISSSKMPIFLTIFLAVILIARKIIRGDMKMLLALCGIIIAFAAVIYFSGETKARLLYFFERGDNVRALNWRISADIIRERPWTGVGTGDALDELNARRDISWFEDLKTYNAHNQYLETTLRTGAFGLALLLAIIFVFFKRAWQARNHLFLAFLFIISCSMITESILVVQKGIFFFGIFASLLAAIDVQNKNIAIR
jgi:O-antigen ligase